MTLPRVEIAAVGGSISMDAHRLWPRLLALAALAMTTFPSQPGAEGWPAAAGGPPAHLTPMAQLPELEAAVTPASLAGQTLTLEAELTRDFMPIAPPGGRPLMAILTLQTSDGAAVSADVKADAAWIVKGDQAWAVPGLERQDVAGPKPVLRLVGRGGPKWDPGTRVDVVVRLRDGAGHTALLVARAVPIKRTS